MVSREINTISGHTGTSPSWYKQNCKLFLNWNSKINLGHFQCQRHHEACIVYNVVRNGQRKWEGLHFLGLCRVVLHCTQSLTYRPLLTISSGGMDAGSLTDWIFLRNSGVAWGTWQTVSMPPSFQCPSSLTKTDDRQTLLCVKCPLSWRKIRASSMS